jgi:hypothetical protein
MTSPDDPVPSRFKPLWHHEECTDLKCHPDCPVFQRAFQYDLTGSRADWWESDEATRE